MANYSLRIKRSAAKEIEALPPKDRRRIVAKIQALAGNPRPVGPEKLSGEDKYRLRQGDYRILYEIIDAELVVTVAEGFEVLSNGKLIRRQANSAEKTVTFHWLQDKPHVSYLVSLAAVSMASSRAIVAPA